MPFGNAKYSITFADAQDRTNIVYLDPDETPAYSGGTTAITPAEDPLVYEFGSSGDDEYRALNPTALTIRVKVDDTALFTDVSGDASLSWRVRWFRDDAKDGITAADERWRGYLITDEIEQPFDLPSVLTLRAVCGLKELDGIVWDTAAVEDSFVDHAADILSKLTGHANDIQFQANWHAYNGGSAVTGNSYNRYTFDSAAFNDPLDSTKDSVCSVALQNLVGRFGGKIFFADGDWWMIQRDLLAGGYTPDTRAYVGGGVSTGSAVSAYTLTDAEIYSGAIRSNAPAYYQVPIVYYHYPLEAGFFLNGGFEDWDNPATVPDNWTEFGPGSKLTRRGTAGWLGFSRDSPGDGLEYQTFYGCEVHAVEHSGSDYGTDSVDNATQGIYQESQFDVNGTDKLSVSFDAMLNPQAASNTYLDFYYAIWLNTSGTDYYWDADNGAWASGTLGAAAGKMPRRVTNASNTFSIETDSLPASSGRVRVYLYNVVDYSNKIPANTGIIYDNFKVSYSTGDKNERVKTAVIATNGDQTSGLIRAERSFFIGQGPTDKHTGAIKGGDVIATLASGATWDGTNTSLPVGASLSKSLVANDKILVYTTTGTALMVTVNANVSSGASPIVLTAADGDLSASIASGSTVVYGWMVENWKEGSYAGAEGSSGKSLDRIHAEAILANRDAPVRRLRLTFRPSSGTYWPYQPLSYESKSHSCVSLRYSARFDEYSGEWLAVETSGASQTIEEEYGDDFIKPTDYVDPGWFDEKGPRGTGGVRIAGGSTDWSVAGSMLPKFPRAVRTSTDASNVLGNNYFSGTLELAQTAAIETADYTTSGGVYIDYSKIEFKLSTVTAKLAAGLGAPAELTLDNTAASQQARIYPGYARFDLGSVGNANAINILGGDIYGDNGDNISLLGKTTGDLTVGVTAGTLKFQVASGTVLSMPQADGTTNQVLKTDGAGNLDWTTISAGSGDVVGPASATDNAVARFDTTTGKLIQNSGVIIDDSDNVSGIGTLTATTLAGTLSTATQNSVTTMTALASVGTITSGTWQGTDVGVAHGGTGASTAAAARTNLGLVIGTDVQAYNAHLEDLASLGVVGAADLFMLSTASGTWSYKNPTQIRSTLSISNVEDTALSTWAGSANITTLGTIGTGTWQGTAIASAYLDADTMHLSVAQSVTGKKTYTFAEGSDAIDIKYLTASSGGNTTVDSPRVQFTASGYVVSATDYSVDQYLIMRAADGKVDMAWDDGSVTFKMDFDTPQFLVNGTAASLVGHAHAASDITSGTLALARGGTGASLADPNDDRILFWDDSAGAVTWLDIGDGLGITGGTTLQMDWSASAGSVTPYTVVVKDGDTNIKTVALGDLATASTINNDDWLGADLSLANGGTGASLVDPNADRILFWDDSAGAVTWMPVGEGLEITGGTTIRIDKTPGTADAWPTSLIGFDGDSDYVSVSVSSFGSTLIDDADASAARTTLGLDGAYSETLWAQHDLVQTRADDANPPPEKTLISATAGDYVGTNTIPANYLEQGKHLRLSAAGYYENDGTNSFVLRVMWGGLASGGGTTIASKTITLPDTSVNEYAWELRLSISVDGTSGTDATCNVHGSFDVEQTDGTFTSYRLGQRDGQVTLGSINSTNDLIISGDWGTYDAVNSPEFGLMQATLEEIY